MRRRCRAALPLVSLLVGWTWIVCFPNPFVLPRNLYRYFRFPVDPTVVTSLPRELPDAPRDIELFLKDYIDFQWDWRTYGVLWMMPHPGEVVERRKGDCESVAVVLASVLEAKGIPYDVQASFSHCWIDYPGKARNQWEQDGASYFGRRDGKLFVKPPSVPYLQRHLLNHKEGLWDAMPRSRKVLLVAGWLAVPLVWTRWRRRSREEAEQT